MEIPHLPHDDETPEATPSVPAAGSAHPTPPARRVFLLGPVLGTLRHRWPEYLIEIVVIVFSISISFAFDQWKERRHEHEVEQLYLKTLSANLASDIDSLHEAIAQTQEVIRAAQALIAASAHPAAAPPAFLDKAIQVIAKRPSFVAHDTAFSDLRSSGNLRVLHDFRLKNALFDYYGDYESLQAVQIAEREVMITLIGPYIFKKISIGGSPPAGATTASILGDLEFSNSIWIRLHDRRELLGDYESELDLAQRIRKRIARQIE